MTRLLALLALLAPLSLPAHAQSGIASWYGPGFCGHKTASGERFNCEAMTAACRAWPLGSILRVSNGRRAITVRCNDRGPFVPGRIIDLSPAAKRALGMGGTAHVTVERVK